jgi:hypothetical protein
MSFAVGRSSRVHARGRHIPAGHRWRAGFFGSAYRLAHLFVAKMVLVLLLSGGFVIL